jgi:hypothetical protein
MEFESHWHHIRFTRGRRLEEAWSRACLADEVAPDLRITDAHDRLGRIVHAQIHVFDGQGAPLSASAATAIWSYGCCIPRPEDIEGPEEDD